MHQPKLLVFDAFEIQQSTIFIQNRLLHFYGCANYIVIHLDISIDMSDRHKQTTAQAFHIGLYKQAFLLKYQN